MFPEFETLLVDRADRVIRITLNRPDKLNAINKRMVDELHRLLELLERDCRDSVLIFRGAAARAFVAGADVAELRERRAPEALAGINAKLMDRIAVFPFVTIAQIRGFCIGGGLELALACDLRFAADDAVFAQPEVGLGIIPGAGATHRLPAIVGRGVARELIFTGARIDARRAREIGLVNHVCRAGELSDYAGKIAHRIVAHGAEAVSLAKSVMNLEDGPASSDPAGSAQAHLFESDEKMRRMAEFLSKKR